MNKKYGQIFNTVLIVIGGGILIYTISGEYKNRYLQILGLVVIMFGLYRATNHWVETKDDHKDENDPDNNDKTGQE
ncbi:hypothetical protein [Gillisia limnaea]|uniref:Uncharacterized protein n=1 Tax=Gillisia limnaea (strain DSM 15749 / LMG 21470 / R-8282) TaxID=865937 RepID=H2BQM3_GILLR|nr:hypothetical protein [Gillisia limnaea]EHQ04192.1 hypothetical protein Gilli_0034 [Gillisia limnaea DSM 15749]